MTKTAKNSDDIIVKSEIKQWGNSLGVRIPKEICGGLSFSDGSRILISLNAKSKKITIQNMVKDANIYDLAKNLNLRDLTKKMTKKNLHKKEELISGIVGKEIW